MPAIVPTTTLNTTHAVNTTTKPSSRQIATDTTAAMANAAVIPMFHLRTAARSAARASARDAHASSSRPRSICRRSSQYPSMRKSADRSEEHTSELQSLAYLVCRLLLEKKNNYDHSKYS